MGEQPEQPDTTTTTTEVETEVEQPAPAQEPGDDQPGSDEE